MIVSKFNNFHYFLTLILGVAGAIFGILIMYFSIIRPFQWQSIFYTIAILLPSLYFLHLWRNIDFARIKIEGNNIWITRTFLPNLHLLRSDIVSFEEKTHRSPDFEAFKSLTVFFKSGHKIYLESRNVENYVVFCNVLKISKNMND